MKALIGLLYLCFHPVSNYSFLYKNIPSQNGGIREEISGK